MNKNYSLYKYSKLLKAVAKIQNVWLVTKTPINFME